MTQSAAPRLSYWSAVTLLLLYAAFRLHALLLFPLFIDEAFHIRWARAVWDLHPFEAVGDGRVLIAWVLAPFAPFENALFVSRAGIILVGTLGLAALLALARRMAPRRPVVVWASSLLYINVPYLFFFERLVLADALAASLGLVAAWLGWVALRRHDTVLTLLAGATFAAATLAKTPALVYLVLPALAWLLLPSGHRRGLRSLALIYLSAGVLLGVTIALSSGQGDFGVGKTERIGTLALLEIPGRVLFNLELFGAWTVQYLGWAVIGLALLGLGIAIVRAALPGGWRRHGTALYAIGLALLPLAQFWVLSIYPYPRYYLLGLGGVILLAGYAVTSIAGWMGSKMLRIAAAAALLLVACVPGVRFVVQANTDPARLPLVEPDARDYVWANPSGYGIREGAAWLHDYAQEIPGVTVICVDYITCERLSIIAYLPDRITTSSTDILNPAWLAAERAAGRDVLLAQDDPPQVMAFDPASEYRLEEAGRWERPTGQTAFTLYRIVPVPQEANTEGLHGDR